jgi:hypothetical protein
LAAVAELKTKEADLKRLILIASIFAAGCASTVKLDDSAKASINSISISENVVVPQGVSYIGPAAAFGLIGVVADAGNDTPQNIKNHLEKNNIDVGKIVKEQFEQEARQNPFLGSRLKPSGAGAEARIEIEIRGYGLGQKRGFSNNYVPMLGYAVKMFDGTNRVVWEKYDYVTAFTDGIPTYQFEEYFQSDAAFRTAYTESARIIARNLVKDIGEPSHGMGPSAMR